MIQSRYRAMGSTPFFTFQAALRGADGIVIASDTKIVMLGEIRSTGHRSKISVFPHQGIVCAWSGDDVAVTAVDRVADWVKSNRFRVDEVENEVTRLCGEAWKHHWGEEVTPIEQIQTRGNLIVATAVGRRLWWIDIRGSQVRVFPSDDKTTAGDRRNSAVFFLERYVPDAPTPIDRLTFLAAHTVLMAGRLNPQYIDGLEVALCSERETRMLSESEIAALRSRSAKLDGEILAGLNI